jgi:hypothetical protein
MLVAKNHMIALDTAVASDVAGERAFRLLHNQQHVAADLLPYLLITTCDDPKIEHVRCDALIQRLRSCL